MWDGGFTEYIHDWWNLMDFAMNSLYLATISLKIVAYVKVKICVSWLMYTVAITVIVAASPLLMKLRKSRVFAIQKSNTLNSSTQHTGEMSLLAS